LSMMPHPQPYTIGWLSQGWDLHINQQWCLHYDIKTLTLEDETPKVLWAMRRLVDMSTSQGCNICIPSSFRVCNSSFERIIWGLQLFPRVGECHGNLAPPHPSQMSKKHCLGPQNDLGSLGPEKP
jgi:hypothetical protein